MSQDFGLDAVPQIFSELNQLSLVEVEYSSTLYSYQYTTRTFGVFNECLRKEILNRTEEMKHFSTDQGIGLRKILLEHYERLYSMIEDQHKILNEVTMSIYEKQKSMQNSLNFIEPVVKEIEHKTKVLEKELIEVRQKVAKLEESKKKKLSKGSQSIQLNKKVEQIRNSEISKQQKKSTQKHQSPRAGSSSVHCSLFSIRKFDKLETEAQFNQVQSFLQLRVQQVEEFARIENELTEKTVRKIYQIFDQILGKGLERLEINLLNKIKEKRQNISTSSQNQSERDSINSTDLQCYETMEEMLDNQRHFEKIKRVKKRLYHSTHIRGVDLTESIEEENENDVEEIEVSPTFNSISPLIFDSGQDLNRFSIKSETIAEQISSAEKSIGENMSSFHLFDSFSKENINTLNN